MNELEPTRARRRRIGWTVTLEAAGPHPGKIDDDLEALHHLLVHFDATVSGRSGSYRATLSLDEPGLDAASALSLACEIFHDHAVDAGLPDWPVVRAEVMMFSERDFDVRT